MQRNCENTRYILTKKIIKIILFLGTMYRRPQAKYAWVDTVGLDDSNFDDQETFKDILRFIGKKHSFEKYASKSIYIYYF